MKRSDRDMQARALIAQGLAMLQTDGPDQSPTEVLQGLIPAGVKLYASKAARPMMNGAQHHYYLVMPHNWTPRHGDRRWLYNERTGTYWDTEAAHTHDDALRLGMLRLMAATMAVGS